MTYIFEEADKLRNQGKSLEGVSGAKSMADTAVGDLQQFVESLSDQEKDGLGIWVNPGPPKMAIVDFMDWWGGEADAQQRIKSALAKWCGDEANVIVQNE